MELISTGSVSAISVNPNPLDVAFRQPMWILFTPKKPRDASTPISQFEGANHVTAGNLYFLVQPASTVAIRNSPREIVMRPIGFVKSALSHPQFEILEDRLVMSAQPLTDWLLDDQVEQQTEHIEPTFTTAHDLTGWIAARNDYGFDGTGQTVVVIDSGVAWDHVDLGGGFGPGYRVVGGWDFTEENDADPYDDGPAGAHGTHVAGIIGSSHAVHTGVAAGVDLVALRVFNDTGQGHFSWVEEALQWVHENRDAFENPITTVNLSLGTIWNGESLPDWATLEDEFAQLEADGIFISVAAGNAFATYNDVGLSYPAASEYVVAVASVDDTGQFSDFSQRSQRVIAAPGSNVTSTVPDYVGNFNRITDDYLTLSGTSMAAPYVAGASVLIRQAFGFAGRMDVTQDDIYDVMRQTADLFYDPATEASYHRLNLKAALDAIMPADDYGSTLDAAHELGRLAETNPLALTGVFNTLSDRDYFTFTADATGTATVAVESRDNTTFATEILSDSEATYANGAFTFDVIAGNSYGFMLSAGGALGRYEFDLALQAASVETDDNIGEDNIGEKEVAEDIPDDEPVGEVTPGDEMKEESQADVFAIDLGPIDWQALTGETWAQDAWYRIEAVRDGMLTVRADSQDFSDAIRVEIYTGSGEELDSYSTGIGSARADRLVAAGDELLVRVRGAESGDLLLANIVEIDGAAVTFHGTDATDQMAFRVGAEHSATVNGLTYHFDASLFDSFAFRGGEGNDRFDLIGSHRDETVRMSLGSVQFESGPLTVTALDFTSHYISGKGGTDTAIIEGTPGADRFYSRMFQSWMIGAGYYHKVYQFENVQVVPSAGDDLAYLDGHNGRLVVEGHATSVEFVRPDATITIGAGATASVAEPAGTGASQVAIPIGGPSDFAKSPATEVAAEGNTTLSVDPGNGLLPAMVAAVDASVEAPHSNATKQVEPPPEPANLNVWADWSDSRDSEQPSTEVPTAEALDAYFGQIDDLLDDVTAYAEWLATAESRWIASDPDSLVVALQSMHLSDLLPFVTIE